MFDSLRKVKREVPMFLLNKVFKTQNAGESLCIAHKLKYDLLDIADSLS